MIHTYESVVIFHGDLEEDVYKILVDEYREKLSSLSHKVTKTDKLYKKALAYPIKRGASECKDGWYAVFTFQTNPDFIAEWERLLRIDDKVLKFITVRLEDEEDLESYSEEFDTTVSESEQHPDVKPDASNIDLFDLIFNYDTHLTSSQDCDIISKKKGVK